MRDSKTLFYVNSEIKYLDPHSNKRSFRPKLLEILLKDKKGFRRIYYCLMSQIHHKPLCQKNGLRTYLFQMITTGEKFLKILNLSQKIPHYSGSNKGLLIES